MNGNMPPAPAKVYTFGELRQSRAFEGLFDEYSQKIFRYLYLHLSSKEDAEDALSTTFVKLWEYLQKADRKDTEIRNVSALIYRIARNLVIDQYRARRPSVSVEAMQENGIELPDIRSLDMSKRAELSLVLKTFERLERDERDLLLLRFIEDMPVTDIADIYDITENNASVRIHRALSKLKNIISA